MRHVLNNSLSSTAGRSTSIDSRCSGSDMYDGQYSDSYECLRSDENTIRNNEGRRLSLECIIEGLLNADGLLNSKEDPVMLLKENMIDQNGSGAGAEALRNVESVGL